MKPSDVQFPDPEAWVSVFVKDSTQPRDTRRILDVYALKEEFRRYLPPEMTGGDDCLYKRISTIQKFASILHTHSEEGIPLSMHDTHNVERRA